MGGVEDLGSISNPILATETGSSLKNRSIAELKIKCPSCANIYDFPGIFHPGKEVSGMICIKCHQQLPE